MDILFVNNNIFALYIRMVLGSYGVSGSFRELETVGWLDHKIATHTESLAGSIHVAHDGTSNLNWR